MSTTFETVILRFRDLVTAENETIAKHLAVIGQHGYVWWAWWKKGNEKTPKKEFAYLSIEAKSQPLDIFLVDSGQSLVYRATCSGVELTAKDKIPSPERDKTPEYYCDQEYYAWFKFTKIEPCDESDLTGFSYVGCDSLFGDDNADYSQFNDKRIYSIKEIIQQNRTVWFARKARDSDRNNEIILLNADFIQPSHFSAKYYQSSGDTIVWLSDLHLYDHLFESERGKIRQTLAQHLLRCLDKRRVAGLLITGDITSFAKESGFDEAQRLLQDINYDVAGLNAENILICPGNHDFAWEGHDLLKDAQPAFIYDNLENAKGFSGFYHSIYKIFPNRFFASGKKLLLSSGHILEIAALNSLLLQQYPNFESHGYLSQEQLDYVAQEMGWDNSDNQNAIRIVMMHHHYLPACYTEVIDVTRASSAVYDADRLMNWLVKYDVRLLLHGHKHRTFVSEVNYPVEPEKDVAVGSMRRITVVGMGGTGAAGVENKFATIHFSGDEAVIEFHKIHSDDSSADAICQKIEIPYK